MGEAPAEQSSHDPDLLPPGHNLITQANWEELRATQGFQMLMEQVDLDTPEGQRSLKNWQRLYGPEYIYVGSAFEWDERRPVDHKPGVGIYVNREGQRRAGELDDSPHSSPDTGPASS
jgi:hypothetical protein